MKLLKEYDELPPILTHIVMIVFSIGVAMLVYLLVSNIIIDAFIPSPSMLSIIFNWGIFGVLCYLAIKEIYLKGVRNVADVQELGYYGIIFLFGQPLPWLGILIGSGQYALLPYNMMRIGYIDMRPQTRKITAKITSSDGEQMEGEVAVQFQPIDIVRAFYVSETFIVDGLNGIITAAIDEEGGKYDYLQIASGKKDEIREAVQRSIHGKEPYGTDDLHDYNIHVISVAAGDFRSVGGKRESSLTQIVDENIQRKAQAIEQQHYQAMIDGEFAMYLIKDPGINRTDALKMAIDQVNLRTGKRKEPTEQRIIFGGNKVDSLMSLGALLGGNRN